MSGQFTYDAFISYRRADGASAARALRRRLLDYRLPRALRSGPSRKPSIYLDQVYEQADEDFFQRRIRPALESSQRLIVIHTPAVLEPRSDGEPNWVEREVQHFRMLPQRDNISMAIASGALDGPLPGGLDHDLPLIQRVDLRRRGPMRRRFPQAELLQLVAALHDIPQERMPELLQEEARRRAGRAALLAGLATLVSLALAALLVWALISRAAVQRALATTYLEKGLTLGENRTGLAWLAAAVRTDPGNVLARGHLASVLVHASWPLPVLEIAQQPLTELGSRHLATWARGQIHVWDLIARQEVGQIPTSLPHQVLLGHSERDLLISDGPAAGVWDVPTVRQIAQLPVSGASWRTRGDHFLYRSDKAGAGLWNPRTGRIMKNLNWSSISPDGRLILEQKKRDVRILDLITGQTVLLRLPLDEAIFMTDFSPEGELFLTRSARQITSWDPNTGKVMGTLPVTDQFPIDEWVPFDANSILTLNYKPQQYQVWRRAEPSWQPRAVISFSEGLPVDISADGRWLLLTAQLGEEARLRDLATGVTLAFPAQDPVFIGTTDQVVTKAQGLVRVWRIGPAAKTLAVPHRKGRLALVPTQDRILSFDGTSLQILDARTGRTLSAIPGAVPIGIPEEIVMTPDGRFAAADTAVATLIWDLGSGHVSRLSSAAQPTFSIDLSPDGRWLVRYPTFIFQETATGRPSPRIESVQDPWAVWFLPGDKVVILSRKEESLSFWNLLTRKPLESHWKLPGTKALVLSADGRRLAAAWEDGRVSIFDVATRKVLTTLPSHSRPDWTAYVKFDASNRLLFTGMIGTGRLWDTVTGATRGEPFPLSGGLQKTAFSRDGSRFLLWDGEDSIRVLDTSSSHPVGASWRRGPEVRDIQDAGFSSDGQSVYILQRDGEHTRSDVWDLPILSQAEALKLTRLAEAVSGSTLDANTGQLVDLSNPIGRLNDLRRQAADAPFGEATAASLIRWFLADPAKRPRSPLASEMPGQ